MFGSIEECNQGEVFVMIEFFLEDITIFGRNDKVFYHWRLEFFRSLG
jgi:hypothetical protein